MLPIRFFLQPTEIQRSRLVSKLPYFDNDDMKHVLYDSEIRIRSMAMIHKKLYHHYLYAVLNLELMVRIYYLLLSVHKTIKAVKLPSISIHRPHISI